MTYRSISTLAMLALASVTVACAANKPSAEASAKAPGQEGSVATYASTDEEDHEFFIGSVYVPLDDDEDHDAPDAMAANDQPEPTSQTVQVDYVVDATLLDACGLVEPTVYFDHDSEEIDTLGEIRIDRIADCLEHPALEDENVEVVGHASEPGAKEYNRELGFDRAEAVAEVLASEGIDRSRILTQSRGERAADEPENWDDRRVVIRLDK